MHTHIHAHTHKCMHTHDLKKLWYGYYKSHVLNAAVLRGRALGR
jgi:hypothetical protein